MSNTFAKILENVRDGFNKLTGTPQTPLARQCEDCVADVLTSTPWAGIQDLCTNVNHGDVGENSDTVLGVLSRKISHPNPRTQIHCLEVSDMCVRYCGPVFHDRLAASTFFSKVQRAIMQPNAMGRDAQVLDRMLVLMEDWARSLPQPQFAAAHTSAMKAGVQGPQRAEHQKAPLLDGMRYDLQRREQLAVQQMWRQQERLGRDRIPEYDRLSPTPPAPPVHPQMQRQGHPGQVSSQIPQIDTSVLESMDPADRAAVLAAQYDDDPLERPDASMIARSHLPGSRVDDMPKFDVHGSLEAIRADLGVAKENVGVLNELLAADAPPDLLEDVLWRCRTMRGAVLKVIDIVTDESTLDEAVQVQTELAKALQDYEAKPRTGVAAVAGQTLPASAVLANDNAQATAETTDPPQRQEFAPFQYPPPGDVSSNLGDTHPLQSDPVAVNLGPSVRSGGPTDNPFSGGGQFSHTAPTQKQVGDLINFDTLEAAHAESEGNVTRGKDPNPDPNDLFAAPVAHSSAAGCNVAPVVVPGGSAPYDEVGVEDVVTGLSDLGVTAPAERPPPSTTHPMGPSI